MEIRFLNSGSLVRGASRPVRRRAKRRSRAGLGALLFLLGTAAAAQSYRVHDAVKGFPENWEARLAMRDILTASSTVISSSIRQTREQRIGAGDVMLRVASVGDSYRFMFLFVEPEGETDPGARGNIAISKKKDTDQFEYMKVMLRSSADCYARIAAGEQRSIMEVVLFGKKIYDEVKIPLPLERLLTLPFSEIARVSASLVDWDLVLWEGVREPTVVRMVEELRSRLPLLEDLEDGAYDRDGRPVYIDSESASPGGMNCSGFVKWVVDGFYYPVVGAYTDVGRLKRRLLEHRGTRWSRRYEEERDPYFGLDWCRNLATVLEEARTGRSPVSPESFDVRHVPFFAYVEDVGYPVEDLDLILFVLARENPRSFYLGSINRPFGEDGALRQHIHLVVLIPYFDEAGLFHAVVMERNTESSVDSLTAQYRGEFIHLVEIEADTRFEPLQIPKEKGK